MERQELLYNNSGGLSKREQEAMIHFNESGDKTMVYTFNASLKRELAELALKCPSLCRITRSTAEVDVTYMADRAAHGMSWECPKQHRKSA